MASQEAPDPRHPRIVLQLEQARLITVTVGGGLEQCLAHRVGSVDHRAELEHAERAAVLPDAGLSVEHRSPAVAPDRDRGDQKERRKRAHQQAADHEVQGALGHRRTQ